MLAFYFSILASVLLASAPPAQAKIDLRPKEPKIEDPGSATPLLYQSPTKTEALGKKASRAKVRASCTDSLGLVVSQGDKGYDACLRNLDRTKIHDASEKSPNSVGITFGN